MTPDRSESKLIEQNVMSGEVITRPRLSDELGKVISAFGEGPVCLRDIVNVLQTRGYFLLLLLLALPFCTPLPLPGVSTPFGVVICLIGFRLSLRQEPYLPKRWLDRVLPQRFFPKVLAASRRVVLALEYLVKPRMTFLIDNKAMHHLGGFLILFSGVLLLLPIPVPFTNIFPAITIVLIAAAMLERDGLALVGGIVCFLLTVAFFTALVLGGKEVFSVVWEYVAAWFR